MLLRSVAFFNLQRETPQKLWFKTLVDKSNTKTKTLLPYPDQGYSIASGFFGKIS
jgi:hypothetical protein